MSEPTTTKEACDAATESATGGVIPMSITGRMADERERCIGMSAEERAWRAQWCKDQILEHDEPTIPEGYYEARYNPIRRFYRAPMDKLERALTPKLGLEMAETIRHCAAKTAIGIGLVYLTFYYFKYNSATNSRLDGRSRLEYRMIEIESKLMEQVNGSARVRLGNSDIMAGVKLEIDAPFPDSPFEGKLEFFVDCSANATPEFEGKGGDDIANEISHVLSRTYQSPQTFDLRSLSILPHKKCWKMFVDILILQCGGNLFDAVGVAVKAALNSTEIPKVTSATVDGAEADIHLSDDIYDCTKLDVTNFPLFVTVCKIGDHCIVDPTSEEEMCSAASLVISVMPNGKITSTVKKGYGSLLPATLMKTIEIGTRVGIQLNNAVVKQLKREEELGPKKPIYGFLR
ncbi:exosome complex exonuclease RRP42 [Belonocnema kinseyi]|uniref:exosome complex exonuclease RRP42 n=1 Tax=Belonocnema kinseyi TaxID=2817044 RepID=UPI00143D370A|nr:exosome complex exonuclease RRP42 [Belonocnema kinseyi]